MTDKPVQQPSTLPEQIHPDSDQQRTPKKKPKSGSSSNGVSFLTAAVIAMAFSGFSSFVSYHFATSDQQQTSQIVLVDGTKLANAQMQQTLAKPGMTPEQAEADGLGFVSDLQTVLKGYSDAGIVVINSSVVMNTPRGINVTNLVAQRLGLTLE